MSPIFFCRATRKRFEQELKAAKRAVRAEQVKKAKDEVTRKAQLAVGNEGYGSPSGDTFVNPVSARLP